MPDKRLAVIALLAGVHEFGVAERCPRHWQVRDKRWKTTLTVHPGEMYTGGKLGRKAFPDTSNSPATARPGGSVDRGDRLQTLHPGQAPSSVRRCAPLARSGTERRYRYGTCIGVSAVPAQQFVSAGARVGAWCAPYFRLKNTSR
jgi:hypothetical protein